MPTKSQIKKGVAALAIFRQLEKTMYPVDETDSYAFTHNEEEYLFNMDFWRIEVLNRDIINLINPGTSGVYNFERNKKAEEKYRFSRKSGKLIEWLNAHNCNTAVCAIGTLSLFEEFESDFYNSDAGMCISYEEIGEVFGLTGSLASYCFNPEKYNFAASIIHPREVIERFIESYAKVGCDIEREFAFEIR